MKTKPKLFTTEFVSICIMFLSLVIGVVTILVYRDTLPLWMILVLGFWYPAFVILSAVYQATLGNSRGEDL